MSNFANFASTTQPGRGCGSGKEVLGVKAKTRGVDQGWQNRDRPLIAMITKKYGPLLYGPMKGLGLVF